MEVDPRLNAIIDCLYRVSAKAIIIHERKLLLTLEPEGYYSLPGGGIDAGEKTTEALKRELEEEIEFHDCTFTITPDILFVTNLEILDQIPRMQLYYRAELSDPAVITAKELQHLWATADDLDTLSLSPSAMEAKPNLLPMLA